MQTAAVLFAIAALGGLAMLALRVSKNQNPPTGLAVGHGVIAAAGLITLIYQVLTATATAPQMAQWAIGVFVLAALGGLGMFTLFHLRGKLIPVWIILGHGAVAVAGFVMLLMAIYRP
jgi:predicted membrane channel-forming protein YqfA (hemolysin III family)